MLRPVGSTSGLRIGSPPGPGSTNSPFRASTRPPISLSATTCFRHATQYSKIGASWSSGTSKPFSSRALRIGEPPTTLISEFIIALASEMRPSSSVTRSTEARTAARTMMNSLMSVVGGSPMRKALLEKGFDVPDDQLAPIFEYCEACLKQVVADNEMGGLVEALNGEFVLPGPGGDPIRNPDVLPTGRNMHALDPQAIPTTAACDCAKVVVDRLIARQKEETGAYPESIAVVLWGTDNIKTYGESLAQVLWFLGVRPLPDSLGRVNQIEPVPLEEP